MPREAKGRVFAAQPQPASGNMDLNDWPLPDKQYLNELLTFAAEGSQVWRFSLERFGRLSASLVGRWCLGVRLRESEPTSRSSGFFRCRLLKQRVDPWKELAFQPGEGNQCRQCLLNGLMFDTAILQ